jgi:alkylated DNA repair dioxygenase AlkB
VLQRTILGRSPLAGQSRNMQGTVDPLDRECLELELPDGEARLWPAAFVSDEAARLFDALRAQVHWRQEEILIFGQRRLVPRLIAWHGDPGASYVYSGTDHQPEPWLPDLERIRERVTALCGADFNAVLLNLYRDGRDGMGWHADDETELGLNPVIASVSLGATRRFCLRHRRRKELKLDLDLPHGSLLCMGGATQHHWVHALPKTRRPVGERINLTFRRVALR